MDYSTILIWIIGAVNAVTLTIIFFVAYIYLRERYGKR